MSYAQHTVVSVEKSQGEIRKILTKYKATGFAYAENIAVAMVQFEMIGRRIKFILPLAELHKTRDRRGYVLNQKQTDQENMRRWRCLSLVIKAKLEAVESGITTLEQEFMAHILLPNGRTVSEELIPQITKSYETGQMPPLLGYGAQQ